MSFYIRKAIRVGPLRFNLSRSGIGVSGGIRGLRVGTGPRGHYVHMGRNGLYFRQSLNPGAPPFPSRKPPHSAEPDDLREIESGSVLSMVDSSAGQLLEEMNSKLKRSSLLPLAIILSLAVLAVIFFGGGPLWLLVLSALLSIGAGAAASIRDRLAKTTVLFFDLEPDVETAYRQLHECFDAVAGSAGIWHILARAEVRDAKYNAGATGKVDRRSITLRARRLPYMQTNVEVPTIPAGRQILAFMPDRLLIFDPAGVGAVPYDMLRAEVTQTRFVEDGPIPGDAKVAGRTWRYVNRNGGPDRRFRNNRELPITTYEDIHFQSDTGLNEKIQISRVGVAGPFCNVLKRIAALAGADNRSQDRDM